MQRVLIIWTGFDKFKKGNRTNFSNGAAAGKTLENNKKPFRNKTMTNVSGPTGGPEGPVNPIQPRLDTG
ncbi:conserved hypothetical protein [Burkholderia sp. IT-111MI5]